MIGTVRLKRHFYSTLLLPLALSLFAPRAQCAAATEIEAVLLFNLTRFVDWPSVAFSDANAPVIIGILGRDPFGPELQNVVEGEQVNGRKVVVQRCSTIDEAAHCQVLFISSTEKSRARAVVEALRGHPVLTVSDLEDFARRDGGMMAFYLSPEKKIRLRINLEAAKAEQLNISSKLIHVAELEKSRSVLPRLRSALAFRLPLSPPRQPSVSVYPAIDWNARFG